MPDSDSNDTCVERLESKLDVDWPAIRQARETARQQAKTLDDIFQDQSSPNASLVVFGSVARREVTGGSDLDWILLADGPSTPEHSALEDHVKSVLTANNFTEPGKRGGFGQLVRGHELIENIGGEDDRNSSTTYRALLLLESRAVGNRETYDRIRKQVLQRYLEDDRGLRDSSTDRCIPRFLLNDLARYWRTVTVDFVYKQRADDRKWALRNAKLRMSRKLIFAAGLLHCFLCQLDPYAEDARRSLKDRQDVSEITDYLGRSLSFSPLDLVAKTCLELAVKPETARSIFDNYDRFLAILDDAGKRSQLEQGQSHEKLLRSDVWNEIREVSRSFHDGLVSLFFVDNEELKKLSMRYGVF